MQLIAAFLGVLPTVTWRALPFLVYALVSLRVRLRTKVFCALPFFALLLWPGPQRAPCIRACVDGGAALVYFSIVSLGIFAATRTRLSQRWGSPVVFGVLLPICLFVPALYAGAAIDLTVAIGWEVMLGGYSYCFEHAKMRRTPKLRDCLFFLMVNPTLVYPESGHIDERPNRIARASLRGLIGVLAWMTQDVIIGVARVRGMTPDFISIGSIPRIGYAHFLETSTLALISYYLAHSGLASLRISLMGFSGYQIPECYRLPLLARSPQEFWQRWNVWVGAWFRRYVFVPVSIWIGRRLKMTNVRTVCAVMLTFLAVGALHDCTKYAAAIARGSGSWPAPKGTILFLLFGATLVVWESMRRAWRELDFAERPRIWFASRSAVFAANVLALVHSHFLVYGATLWLVDHWR